MKKIFNYHKYKILAELEWKSDEKDAETPE